MRFLFLLMLFINIPKNGQTQTDSLQPLELDFKHEVFQKIYSQEEKDALNNYSSERYAEPVILKRVLRGAVNSNDMISYHHLVLNIKLVIQYKIKKISYFSGKSRNPLIAWVTFTPDGKEINRFIKYKYVPYTGDYSELCLYKENHPPYVPSTNRLYIKQDSLKTDLLHQFIFDDTPLRPILIKYEYYK